MANLSPIYPEQLQAAIVARIHASLDVQTTLTTLTIELQTALSRDRVLIYPAHPVGESLVLAKKSWPQVSFFAPVLCKNISRKTKT